MRRLQPGQGPGRTSESYLAGPAGEELRLPDISTIETGNTFLPSFVESFNGRFAVPAARPEDLHRKLGIAAGRISDILCHREQRYVCAQLTLSYDRHQIILKRNEISKELGDQYVELYDFPDRPLEVRWKGHLLPYRVFQKDQRVSHTAIVENKRLGHVLRTVKAQQTFPMLPPSRPTAAKAATRSVPASSTGQTTRPNGHESPAPKP